ncbi:MAG: hypothetical protein IKI62_01745 [Clostridia bacterium]|nr:hypothetical protein [Clostridia bacterium]
MTINRCSYDYYVKGLDIETRTGLLFTRMKLDINSTVIDYLTEEPDDFISFRKMGAKDKDIDRIKRLYSGRFEAINEVFQKNNRPPLFPDTSDVYACALRYKDLLKKKPDEELKSEFGCSWQDYVPEALNVKAQ